eukprot:m.169049 g.169049  ORF g.169049 m.169049 type:complete len:596 (+) comp25099_c0_seq1:129-1916(+)
MPHRKLLVATGFFVALFLFLQLFIPPPIPTAAPSVVPPRRLPPPKRSVRRHSFPPPPVPLLTRQPSLNFATGAYHFYSSLWCIRKNPTPPEDEEHETCVDWSVAAIHRMMLYGHRCAWLALSAIPVNSAPALSYSYARFMMAKLEHDQYEMNQALASWSRQGYETAKLSLGNLWELPNYLEIALVFRENPESLFNKLRFSHNKQQRYNAKLDYRLFLKMNLVLDAWENSLDTLSNPRLRRMIMMSPSFGSAPGLNFLQSGTGLFDFPKPLGANMGKTLSLSNGQVLPRVGFGTGCPDLSESRFEDSEAALDGRPPDEVVFRAVRAAVAAGYRSFDTSELYKNEYVVGQVLKESGIPRKELFLISKLSTLKPDEVESRFKSQLEALQTTHIDMYMIHHQGSVEATAAVASKLDTLHAKGLIGSLAGEATELLLRHKRGLPLHLIATQELVSIYTFSYANILKLRKIHNLTIIAISVIDAGQEVPSMYSDPFVQGIAKSHNRSPFQVLLRFALQLGFVVLPCSTNPDHIAANIDVWDFNLNDVEMQLLSSLFWLVSPIAPSHVRDTFGLGAMVTAGSTPFSESDRVIYETLDLAFLS